MPENLAFAVARYADGDDRRLTRHGPIDTHLAVRRIDPQARILGCERPRPEGFDERVEFAADPRHLRLRHAVEPECFHQLVHRRDPVHLRFLDDGQQRVFGAPAWLQQRRKVRAGPDLRNRQVDRAHARVPGPHPVAVACPVRSGVRLCRSAPIRSATSVSIRAWESNRMPSRRGLTVNEQQTRQIVSLWDNSMREVLALTNEAGLEQRLTLLEQRVAALPLKKDIWDVLGTLGSLATPLVVAALGIWRLPAWLHSARTRRTIARSRTGFSRSLRPGGKG
jgi:hypothetical protein